MVVRPIVVLLELTQLWGKELQENLSTVGACRGDTC
jgi:hypothetical protein